jgi:hypothetical protein
MELQKPSDSPRKPDPLKPSDCGVFLGQVAQEKIIISKESKAQWNAAMAFIPTRGGTCQSSMYRKAMESAYIAIITIMRQLPQCCQVNYMHKNRKMHTAQFVLSIISFLIHCANKGDTFHHIWDFQLIQGP